MKVYIIHGWAATPKSDWFPYLKKELTKKNYLVKVPTMPNTNEPEIKSWVNKLNSLDVDSKTIFIGHSVGCQTILRYLENTTKKVSKVILVAPWLTINKNNLDEGEEWSVAKPWAETKIDFDKVKNKAKEFIVIYSKDDPFAISKDINKLIKILNAKKLNLGEKGHICEGDGITTLPEVLLFL